MSIIQFYFLFPALFMLHELEEIIWMPSFVKKLSAQFPDNRILSYYTPFTFNAIVLEQFLILLLSLFLSYRFSNYTIYVSIIIAYIYHVLGHLIQTVVIRCLLYTSTIKNASSIRVRLLWRMATCIWWRLLALEKQPWESNLSDALGNQPLSWHLQSRFASNGSTGLSKHS